MEGLLKPGMLLTCLESQGPTGELWCPKDRQGVGFPGSGIPDMASGAFKMGTFNRARAGGKAIPRDLVNWYLQLGLTLAMGQ